MPCFSVMIFIRKMGLSDSNKNLNTQVKIWRIANLDLIYTGGKSET